MLAIASRNDLSRIENCWHEMTGSLLLLSDFVACKINWNTKVENITEIINEVNVLPANVVFVDDNPVERAAVKAAYPDIRVLGSTPYYVRKILLWSAETQVPLVTEESDRRTEMIGAQIKREIERERMPRETFLATLNIRTAFGRISDENHPRFGRALELLNKTNQFNTTGKRWAFDEARTLFGSGGSFFIVEVADRYTDYGLVGVIVLSDQGDSVLISQFVLSCRVFGLDIELKAVERVCQEMRAIGRTRIIGHIVKTERNGASATIFEKCGFTADGNGGDQRTWTKSLMP